MSYIKGNLNKKLSKKILITGSTGFIGTNIINYLLKKNFYIYDILRAKNKENKKINKLKKNKNYRPIFYKAFNELAIKLRPLKINTIINCATYYSTKNDTKTIENLVQTNIIFCSIVLEALHQKIKKFINFGSMMEYSKNNNFFPRNFYAITKFFFQRIERFYKLKNNKIKFYDLKLYETYGDYDNRKKLIPEIIKNYKKNKTTKIISKNLNMNFVHIKSLIKIIDMIIFKEIKENEYVVKNKKNIRIKKIIEFVNKKLNKKIKVKYLSSKKIDVLNTKLKTFPNWNDTEDLKKFLLENLRS